MVPRILLTLLSGLILAEIVGHLKSARVAEEGLELFIDFRGKTYVLSIAGDSLGILSAQ